MKQTKIGKLTQLIAEEGKFIHKIDTEIYVKSIIMLPSDTIDMYEEVDDRPKYTEEEYKQKVRDLIKERYTIEDEIALYRQKDKKPEEFAEYDSFVEDCKIRAKDLLNKVEE